MVFEKAKSYAKKKHYGQFRKFSGQPYITHPTAVAEKLMMLTNDTDIICAAYLHDTLEDTDTTETELKDSFGESITKLVLELTSEDYESLGLRKEVYLSKKINTISQKGRLLKLADRWHNVSDLLDETTPEPFRIRYVEETSYILKHIEFTPTKAEKKLIEEISDIVQETLKKNTNIK